MHWCMAAFIYIWQKEKKNHRKHKDYHTG
jgi:hypothetical protein